MQTELNANTISLPSDITTFGHIVLTIHPTNYTIKLPTVFPPPINPGLGPTISHRATAPAIAQARFTYKIEKNKYNSYHATDRVLKTQILKATPDMLTEELNDEDI